MGLADDLIDHLVLSGFPKTGLDICGHVVRMTLGMQYHTPKPLLQMERAPFGADGGLGVDPSSQLVHGICSVIKMAQCATLGLDGGSRDAGGTSTSPPARSVVLPKGRIAPLSWSLRGASRCT